MSQTKTAPAPSKEYNGVAYGYITATNNYGTVNQNAGYSQSQLYGDGTQATIGAAGLARALSDGYSLIQVQAWVDKTGAVVGPEAKKLGLR